MEKEFLLLELYKENWLQVRHHEQQRSSVSNIIIIINAGIIGLITFDKVILFNDLALTFLVFILGLFGCIFVLKQHERSMWHIRRARQYRLHLESVYDDLPIKQLNSTADSKHKNKMPIMFNVRLYIFWSGLHFIILCIGLILCLFILI